MSDDGYVIVRQQAGPFVKAYSTDRRSFVRRSKNWISKELGRGLQRTPKDKLELYMALFGYDGCFYTLTFEASKTPKNYTQAKNRWEYFLRKILIPWSREQDAYKKWKTPTDVDYAYRIEHLHSNGGEGWHIHVVLNELDFPPAVIQHLWPYGHVHDEPVNYKRIHESDGFRLLANYMTKETPDLGRHAFGASQSLKRKLPKAQVSYNKTGAIGIPPGAVRLKSGDPVICQWGVFNYARYLID